MDRLSSRLHRAPLLLVLGAFAASRAAAYAAGVRPDARKLIDSAEFVDPALLRDHLLASVWWLHGQPPLYNLGLGVVYKLFPSHYVGALYAGHVALGLVGAIAFHLLLKRVGLGPWWAAAVAALAVASPAAILYENLLYYDYPTLVVLILAALALLRFLERPSIARGSWFFSLCACLVLIRTIFQPLWLLLVLGLVYLLAKQGRRAALVSAALPIAVVALVCVKNAVLFGTPTTSSWTGMGWARVTFHEVPEAERARLVREGRLPKVALVAPLSALPAYRGLVPPHAPTGHPVLDQPVKPNGSPNLHNIAYVGISRQYLKADLDLIRLRPGAVAKSVERSFEYFLQPATIAGDMNVQRPKIHAWNHVFDLAFLASTSWGNRIGVTLALGYLAIGLWGLALLRRAVRTRVDATTGLLLFCWLTIVWITVGGNLAECGENYRFRFVIQPIAIVVAAAGLRSAVPRLAAIPGLRRVKAQLS